MSIYTDTQSIVRNVLLDAARMKDNLILAQLNDLIQTGVLLIETTEPVLVTEPYENKVSLRQAIRLTFKGADVLAALQKENEDLRRRITTIEDAVKLAAR